MDAGTVPRIRRLGESEGLSLLRGRVDRGTVPANSKKTRGTSRAWRISGTVPLYLEADDVSKDGPAPTPFAPTDLPIWKRSIEVWSGTVHAVRDCVANVRDSPLDDRAALEHPD